MTMHSRRSAYENLCSNLSLTPSQTYELWEFFCRIFSRRSSTKTGECVVPTTSAAPQAVSQLQRLIAFLALRTPSAAELTFRLSRAKSLNRSVRQLLEALPPGSEIRIAIRISAPCLSQMKDLPSSMETSI